MPSIDYKIIEDLIKKQYEEDIVYWLKAKREANIEGIKCLEDAAKQVIIITSLLQGIYFAAISFSCVKDLKDINSKYFTLFVIFSSIILFFWMTSLYFATRVFLPQFYNGTTPNDNFQEKIEYIQESFAKIIKYKYNNLHYSFALLWISFPLLAINIIIFLIFI